MRLSESGAADDLQALLARLAPPGVAVSAGRVIDLPESGYAEEDAIVRGVVPSRRREFRAGRHHARAALAVLAVRRQAIPRLLSRGPQWPSGTVGSISHSRELCCAVAAREADLSAIGVDVEPVADLDPSLARAILSLSERAWAIRTGNPGAAALRTFVAKEAVFKAFHAATGESVAFSEITVRWVGEDGFTVRRAGDRLALTGRWGMTQGHIVALAWIDRAQRPSATHRLEDAAGSAAG